MGDYELELDSRIGEPDVIYMTLDGQLGEELANEVVEEVAPLVERASEDFYLINDISTFKPLSQDAVEAIERGKQVMADGGVTAAVRVTGESVVGSMQFERVGGDTSYQVAKAETVEDAEDLLEEL
jgi:hypothetical protein